MKMPLPEDPKDSARLLSTKQAVMASVFATAAKIDENQLKREKTNKLDALIELVRQAEQELRGPVIEGRVS